MIPMLFAITTAATSVAGVCPQPMPQVPFRMAYRTNDMQVKTRSGDSYSVSCVMPAGDKPIIWYRIMSAPRDGTIVELRLGGEHPTYALYGWQDGLGWRMVNQNDGTGYHPLKSGKQTVMDHIGLHNDPVVSIMDGFTDITWRPYHGDPRHYEDPTRGAQWKCSYYIPAADCAAHEKQFKSKVGRP